MYNIMRTIITLCLAFALISAPVFSQDAGSTGPSSNGALTFVGFVPSIADQIKDGTFIPEVEKSIETEVNPKRRNGNRVVPGKGTPVGDDPLYALQKSANRFPSNPPSLVFDADPSNGSQPSDPTGVAGPNHYLAAWNSGFRIFDKQGNPLTPEASLGTVILGNNQGDPIVMYDKWADRYIITEFVGESGTVSPENGFEMAVSVGPDPVNDGWFLYQAQFGTGAFPDYTKFSIWPDGYYVTANIFNSGNSDKVWVVEREKMLDGLPAQFVGFPLTGMNTAGFYSPQVFNVTGGDLPPEGNATVVYMQDNSWFGVSSDHLKLWTVNVDWNNINNSSISGSTQLPTTAFNSVFDGGSFANLQQPSGPDIDAMQATIMNQAQFRMFPTHNSAVFNFVVDAVGTGELAAIRWFELRQTASGEPWTIYQEGTYSSPTGGKHAWAGSMAMDSQGNIGLGYSTVSTTESIAIQYTGRLANDPLNVMTVDETLIAQGSGNNSSIRYADYIHLTVDPVDEKTFWHISEYFNPNRRDVVGVFKIAPDLATDVGVIDILSPTTSLMGTEVPVTIRVRNFGTASASNIPVEFQLDGATPLTGIITDEIAPGAVIDYTFATTVDASTIGQDYQVMSTTLLGGDGDSTNDAYDETITNLMGNDLGVTGIIEPMPSDSEPDPEDVTVTIKNFGGTVHENFEINFSVNGGIATTENVVGPLGPLELMQFTFSAEADMQDIDDFTLAAYTSLPGDTDGDNDETTVVIEKTICQPESNCNQGDNLVHVVFEGIDNMSSCGNNGYSAYLDQQAAIDEGNTYDITLTTEHGDQYVKAWIDYNDNFSFTGSERVIDDEIIAEGEGAGVFTETFQIEIEDNEDLGEHLMRIKTNRGDDVPNNACTESNLGETEDYKVVIGPVGLLESILGPNDIEISAMGNQQYYITFDTDAVSNESLIFRLMDIQGRTVVQNWIVPSDGVYTYELDMSYAASGPYLIRIGNQRAGKIARLIVQ